MINEILDALKIREERLTCLGREFLVRELDNETQIGPLERDGQPIPKGDPDAYNVYWWRMFVRSVLDAKTGKPVFADDDIAELRKGSRIKLVPLIAAVDRVNGQDAEDNEKNSTAVQP